MCSRIYSLQQGIRGVEVPYSKVQLYLRGQRGKVSTTQKIKNLVLINDFVSFSMPKKYILGATGETSGGISHQMWGLITTYWLFETQFITGVNSSTSVLDRNVYLNYLH